MRSTPTVKDLLDAWVEAFNDHDLDRHMTLYTEDATLFGSVDELQIGRDAIRAYFGAIGPSVRVAAYPMPQVREMSRLPRARSISPMATRPCPTA